MTAYKDNMDKIQTLFKQVSREWLNSAEPDDRYADDSAYGLNFLAISGGDGFEEEFEERLKDLMKELTDDPNS